MKRFLTVGFTAALVAGGVATGTPAQAASTTVTVTCTSGQPVGLSPSSLTLTPTDQIVFTNSSGGNISVSSWGNLSPQSPPGTWTNGVSVTATASSSGTATFNASGCFTGTFTYTVSSSPSPTPSASGSASSAPTPHVQQFGLPANRSCDEAAPESLNWSGVQSGGWGISWAQWMNDGLGGPVCTRTLAYSTSTQSWVVN